SRILEVVLRVHVGACLDERQRGGGGPVLRRGDEWGAVVVAARFRVGAAGEQVADGGVVVVDRRRVEVGVEAVIDRAGGRRADLAGSRGSRGGARGRRGGARGRRGGLDGGRGRRGRGVGRAGGRADRECRQGHHGYAGATNVHVDLLVRVSSTVPTSWPC